MALLIPFKRCIFSTERRIKLIGFVVMHITCAFSCRSVVSAALMALMMDSSTACTALAKNRNRDLSFGKTFDANWFSRFSSVGSAGEEAHEDVGPAPFPEMAAVAAQAKRDRAGTLEKRLRIMWRQFEKKE